MKDHQQYVGRKLLDDYLFQRPEYSDTRIQFELVERLGVWISDGVIARRRRRFPEGRCWTCWRTGSFHDQFRHDVLLPAEILRYVKRFRHQGLDDGYHGGDHHGLN